MTQATNVDPAQQSQGVHRLPGNGQGSGNGHSNGNGHTYPNGNGAPAAAHDPLRVDVQSARRQSGARRRPALVAEGVDAERDGILADDPTGGAFEQTLSMSGRTPPSSPRPAGPNPPVNPPQAHQPAPREPEPAARPAPRMPRAESRTVHVPGGSGKPAPVNKHVCPFCGTKRDAVHGECPSCGMPDNDESRAATVARVGPWFVLQQRNPSAPGMRFNVLRELVRAGQITAGSIVRGPTTHQLWTYAARVRGLAHLFGICWSCNRRLPKPQPGEEPDDFCVFCGALQEAPANPDQQLEAFTTTESLGTGVSNLAGQVGRGGNGGSQAGSVTITQQAHVPARPRLPRKPHTPRPLPPTPNDGGDALLTTRELATAFNLDRRRSFGAAMARLPWLRTITIIALAVLLVVALWLAYQVLIQPLLNPDAAPAEAAAVTEIDDPGVASPGSS